MARQAVTATVVAIDGTTPQVRGSVGDWGRSRRFLGNDFEHPTEHAPKAIMSDEQNTDVPPSHLSIDPRSAFYDEEVLSRGVGIRVNGAEKTNVHEYDVAEGWVRVEVPTAKDRRGNPMVVKIKGTVEPFFR